MKSKWILLQGIIAISMPIYANAQAPEVVESTPAVEIKYDDPRDPFEAFNRSMWDFNYLYLDRYIIRPTAHGYKNYVPDPIRTGVYNFVYNLDEPSSLVPSTTQRDM